MNAGAPQCPGCGGLNSITPSNTCRFCGHMLTAPQPPAGAYGAAPYGAPPQAYGQPYGAPQAYGAQPQAYGAPPQAYGAPPQGFAQHGYGAPPPVAGFGGGQPWQGGGFIDRSGWGGWSSMFWVRLIIVGGFLALSSLGACVRALTH